MKFIWLCHGSHVCIYYYIKYVKHSNKYTIHQCRSGTIASGSDYRHLAVLRQHYTTVEGQFSLSVKLTVVHEGAIYRNVKTLLHHWLHLFGDDLIL